MTDIVERRVELCVNAEAIADEYAAELRPKQIERLYAMRVLMEHDADTIEALRSEVTDLQATIIRLTRELGEAEALRAALQEIKDITQKRQLPITNLVNDITTKVLVPGGKIGDEHGHFYCTLQAKLAAAEALLKPQWFYADGYDQDGCCDSPEEVVEEYLNLKPGDNVVQVDCAAPLPSLWYVVHIRTDKEMEALETDDRKVLTPYPSEEAARAALATEKPE